MNNNQAGQSGALNITQLQDTAMNVVEAVCAILCRPVELILRPWHGTRYFQPPIIFFSTLLMILLPVFSAAVTGVVSMIPFTHVRPPIGLFGIGSLAELYFLLSFIHGIRIYRRMIDTSREMNSTFEGPPLPFFYLMPKANKFWFTRIVLEPAFVLVAATILGRIFIFQSSLVTYLDVAALALVMKNWIGWYRGWEYVRTILDTRYAAPIIARMANNEATEEELAQIHLASLPKNLSPEIREATISHLAHIFSPGGDSANHSNTAH